MKSRVAEAPVATTNIPKYSENDLQKIFKAVLEAQASAPNPTPASIVSKIS